MKFKKVPHTFVIVFSLVVLAAVLTWIIPGGEYLRHEVNLNGSTKTVIIENSFHKVDNAPQTWQIFSALFDGFERQAGIIVFIMIIGGAFWIMNQSRAIDVGIFSFLNFTSGLQHNKILKKIGVNNLIIVLIMLLFSIFGAVFGMSEETIAFIIVIVPLAISMGYDSIVGVSMVFVGAGLGFAGAILNPFTIGIAQGLSDLPLYSGIEYRLICWVAINLVGIIYVLRYAKKIHKSPETSFVYDDDEYWREKSSHSGDKIEYYTPMAAWFVYGILSIVMILYAFYLPKTTLTIGNISFTFYILPLLAIIFLLSSFFLLKKSVHFFILNLLIFTIFYLIIGVVGYGWYISEIAALFLALGIASGISIRYTADEIVKQFLGGVKDILSASLIVGLAGGIIIILENGKVIDTILYSFANGMKDMGDIGSVSMMYLIQNGINLIIPSGSAKAALTMPIMAPFSDVIGISRQATVMAFQLGDGFTNMFTPTSGVLIGVLGVARIPYNKWVKFIGPLMIILIVLGFLLLIPTVSMKLNGF